MKTSEFIEKVENMGYEVYETKYWVCVSKDGESRVAEVSRTVRYGMSIVPQRAHHLSRESVELITQELVDLVIEYASTPIKEREEPKLYTARHKWLGVTGENYLNYRTIIHKWSLGNKHNNDIRKAHFTAEQLADRGISLGVDEYWDVEEVKHESLG